jgi:hypothetical protein
MPGVSSLESLETIFAATQAGMATSQCDLSMHGKVAVAGGTVT